MADRYEIGGEDDSFALRINGVKFVLSESYEISTSFFRQPSAFTVHLGPRLEDGDDFRERLVCQILDVARPGSHFELLARAPQRHDEPRWIGIQSGIIDSRGSPNADGMTVEIRGRDYMSVLFDSFFLEEQTFTEKTYYDLTRKILDQVGLTEEKGHILFADDDNRKEVNPSRRAVRKGGKLAPTQSAEEVVRELETGANSGTGKTLYHALRVKLGQRRYDFLQQQYKLAGLFLVASGNGNFYLTRPHRYLLPEARLTRKSTRTSGGQRIEIGNIRSHSFHDDTTMRHSSATVYGGGGGGKAGRSKYRGHCVDEDMTRFGFVKPIAIHDQDVKSNEEAAYVARRTLADERRESWKLSYTVAGHTTPNTAALTPDARGFWIPDTTVIVDDDQLDIHDTLWIDQVTFRRGPDGTETTIDLCHPSDLEVAPPPEPEKKHVFVSDPNKNREKNIEKSAQELTGEPTPNPLLNGSPVNTPALREGGNAGTSSAGPGHEQVDTGGGGAGGFGARPIPAPARGPSTGSQAGGTSRDFGNGGSEGGSGF